MKMVSKRGVELSVNTIVIVILCIIVLVVLVLIFTGAFGKFGGDILYKIKSALGMLNATQPAGMP